MSPANSPDGKAEVLFYHLEQQPLEKVLPDLLERSMQRGWRVVVQAGSEEKLEALDHALWTYSENSFLAHGTARDGDPQRQPIYLTADDGNPNGAVVRFFVDGAKAGDLTGYIRAVILFDGHDSEAVAAARQLWKIVKAAGHPMTYWQQSQQGRWEKKA